MNEKSMLIAERIKAARISAKLNQKELAAKLGINQTRLSNWEVGTSRPLAENIYSLASVLDVSSDYLLGLTDDPQPIQYTQAASTPLGTIDDLSKEDLEAIDEYIELRRLKKRLAEQETDK